jgi:trk system potassium uptake protein TrkH
MTSALAGAVPLYIWGLSSVDAVFEAMSGITTTGSTILNNLDRSPRGILIWRSMLQGIGGVGFIVTGIALLPILKVGGMQLFRTESSDKGEKELSSATKFASATLIVYAALIFLCFVAYLIGGMNFFDAATHAMTTLATGGYSNYDASFGHFSSPFLQWACTFFMVLGALPFAYYIRIFNRGAFKSEQVGVMLICFFIVISLMTLWLVSTRNYPVFEALRLAAFNVVSVVTTTGYATDDYDKWGPFAMMVFFVLTAVGGCTGSTSGGAKTMRWIILYRAARNKFKGLYTPHSVTTIRYEGTAIDDSVISGIIGFFTIFLFSFTILSLILTLYGLDFETAISGSLTTLANVGPGLGDTIGPGGNFSSLADPVKIILTIGMYCGRLEMVTIFVLLTATFWRELKA